MIRPVLGSRAAIGGPLGSGRGGAAAQWFLAGGVSAANCIAAYTPKGAASLAASYDNNAAPGNGLADGTYDAAPGVAPTFDTATGWSFAAASSQFLNTGIVMPNNTNTWSMAIRFSDVSGSGGVLAGVSSTAYFYIAPNLASSSAYYANGTNSIAVAPNLTSGVLAIAGTKAYRNGTQESGTFTGADTFAGRTIYVGRMNQPTPFYITAKIHAIAIYNVTLSAPQVAAISSAMAAL